MADMSSVYTHPAYTHQWLRRHFPPAGRCERCGDAPARGTEYSFNHHPEPHTRNRADYEELCRACHGAKDAWRQAAFHRARRLDALREELDAAQRLLDDFVAARDMIGDDDLYAPGVRDRAQRRDRAAAAIAELEVIR